MGIFSRFKDIINANINSLLDKAEDPEKMIRMMIREMEDTLVDLKSSCAAKMAEGARSKRELEQCKAEISRWEERAELALTKEREDLAREALVQKKNCQNQLEILQSETKHLNDLIDEAKSNIILLEDKLEQVRQKHRLLIQRSKQAEEKKRMNSNLNQAGGSAAMARFEEFENKIERLEAEAELSGIKGKNPLEREFADLESGSNVDSELEALKAKMKKKA